MSVEVRFEIAEPSLDAATIRREARMMLSAVGRGDAELSVLFVDDLAMRALNRDYRGIDRTTDVLAFPQDEAPPEAAGPDVLGDVVIAVPTSRRQASRYKRTLPGEVRRLMVHGVLHLCGHDHKKRAEAEVMRAEERRLLAALRKADAATAGRRRTARSR
jgi:probable rRNA maturation factor